MISRRFAGLLCPTVGGDSLQSSVKVHINLFWLLNMPVQVNVTQDMLVGDSTLQVNVREGAIRGTG